MGEAVREDIEELFAEQQSYETNEAWCYYNRSGRREGHDIPKAPAVVACRYCQFAFGTERGLTQHLRVANVRRPSKCARYHHTLPSPSRAVVRRRKLVR